MVSERGTWPLQWLILVALVAVPAIVGYVAWAVWDYFDRAPDIVMIRAVPALSEVAEAGRATYDQRCAQCHGLHGGGSSAGPALVHPVYRPAHHADVSFKLAVRRGVRAHHWRFGDMPPLPDVSADDLEAMVQYIRELQRANGIK